MTRIISFTRKLQNSIWTQIRACFIVPFFYKLPKAQKVMSICKKVERFCDHRICVAKRVLQFSLLVLLQCITSCNGPCLGSDFFGADEFVLDSYKIREGKFAVLEMGGEESPEVDEKLLSLNKEPGEVHFSGAMRGSVEVDGQDRLYDVLAKIELPGAANLYHSYILRDNVRLPIDFSLLVSSGDVGQNIVLQKGDQIYIGKEGTSSIIVMGDVLSKCVIDLPLGKISVKEALAKAGGFLPSNPSIQVIRGSFARPKIYHLKWEHILYLPNESLLLIPGDMLYISR
jgi:hypothetical protein